ncbi:hypothetical protein [Clostridium sp.]|uniref:hypothetical protein n=1 Tax=Clostridium sp. TaxID=1506 RepID=UPI001A378E74|nr:hypothetical protein [Clostridium sp.]MBK5234046.1 hypothetical protein [Clostridium sp.]
MSKSFEVDTVILSSAILKLDLLKDAELSMYLKTCAAKLESDAKENRKWVDRTSAARNRMTAKSEKKAFGYRLTLAHGVDYGLWLELANEGNYAILDETIKKNTNDIINGIKILSGG